MPAMTTGSRGENEILRFPQGFVWGVSTAAHQVEGGNDNQWSDWEKSGHIRSRDVSGKACDWWNSTDVDFDLAQSLGINSLRLSVEWSRVEPQENSFSDDAL